MKALRNLRLVLLSVLFLPACDTLGAPPPKELDLWVDSAAGVRNEALARLCTDYWESWLRWHPIEATYLGDPRYNGKVPRIAQRYHEEHLSEIQDMQDRWRRIDATSLTPADLISYQMLEEELEKGELELELRFDRWSIDPLEGPHQRLLNLATIQPHSTPRERDQLVERWSGMAITIREIGRELLFGKRKKKVASRTAIEKSIRQLNAILDTSPMDSPLFTLATGGGRWVALGPEDSVSRIAHEELGDAREQGLLRVVNKHINEGGRRALGTRLMIPAADDPLSPEERGEFLYAVLRAVEDDIYPALASYRDILLDDLLPVSRADDRAGLVHLDSRGKAYRAMIRTHTSLPWEECDPKAIHEFGLEEVRRIRAEISRLGGRVLGTSDVTLVQDRLRNDPELHFETREEVQAKAEECLDRASRVMGDYFGILPEAPCEVVRVPAHEEADTTIAYYREPAADGSRPGRYYINTYEPRTRPRYEAEVLAYHEAIPGHHLQIAIAQELDDLPLFRRHAGSTAFVEGWALYTERLCDEMELYSGDLDRFGILSFDAWRACRLVVDTGIHAFGWSREKAIDFLYRNTLLARNNCENEVDRYIAWPGQALAYKLGQREILDLRDEALLLQGDRFDYREFHDRVLENGAVSLGALRSIVRDWLGVPVSGMAPEG